VFWSVNKVQNEWRHVILGQIFAGVLSHHYEPPSAFSFDIDSTNPPFQVNCGSSW
jgi:hypothetical protein